MGDLSWISLHAERGVAEALCGPGRGLVPTLRDSITVRWLGFGWDHPAKASFLDSSTIAPYEAAA